MEIVSSHHQILEETAGNTTPSDSITRNKPKHYKYEKLCIIICNLFFIY